MRRVLHRLRPGACSVGIIAAMLVHANAATAQVDRSAAPPATNEDAATAQARALFNEGTESADRGDWSRALSAFERSDGLHAHAVTTYNIAYCERALGRYTRARKIFGKALAESAAHGRNELPDDLASAAKTYLAELEQQIARAVVSVLPEGAAIVVDRRPLEKVTGGARPVLWAGTREPGLGEPAPTSTFELELDPGPHVLVVSRAGYVEKVVARVLDPGSEEHLTLKLSPLPQPALAPPPAVPPSSPPSARKMDGSSTRPNGLPFYVALGLGAAGLATGAVVGGIALAQKQKVGQSCPHFACTGDGSTYLARADTAADVSTAGFIAGGAGAATAVAIWWLSKSATGRSRTSGSGGTGRREGLGLAPWVAPTGGGVSGTF
jgi:hypothetical protein